MIRLQVTALTADGSAKGRGQGNFAGYRFRLSCQSPVDLPSKRKQEKFNNGGI